MPRHYLHGYSPQEQDRLYYQARFLEKSVYSRVDLKDCTRLLEVGCGVGAQTEILLERFPNLTIRGLDAEPAQIKRAAKHLKRQIAEGRVTLETGDALHLPHPDDSFDSAFLCWFLEHVEKPVEILRELRRVLTAGGVIYCSEVMNATFYVHPYSPATLQYWFAFNDHQWTLKGDPFVGGKLGNYLLAAGFQDVSTEVKVEHYDNRAPKGRTQFIELWTNLLLSGAPNLLKAGKVTQKLVNEMKHEMERLKQEPDAVFFYSWVQARARVY